jgi:hypothetical protein
LGDEWTRFDQRGADAEETAAQFDQYFSLFPWADLAPGAKGFDAGCGSGLLIPEARPAELARGAEWFVDSVLAQRETFRARAREVGLRHFALENAARRYAEALAHALR